MSDADSESEFSDHSKALILEKALLIMRNSNAAGRKRRYKNKFQRAHRLQKCICLGLLAFVLVTITVIISLTILAYWDVSNSHNTDDNKQHKSILALNWHFDALNQATLANKKCKIVTADTNNVKLTPDDYYRYDAIVLNSTAELVLLGMDVLNCYKENQLRIFATQKPLQYSDFWSEGLNMQSFTKSLSYSLKSDFLWQPYKIVRLNDSKIIAPSLEPQWSVSAQSFKDGHKRDFFLDEVREASPVALTVLQKPCHRARQNLIKLIMENMDVHIYGECGNLTCPYNCLYLPSSHDNKRYKFYLAFEEELCADYIGENFFKALAARLLPVVFGGANYTHFAPPNSYINARDFASIRELTDYLLYLDQNPEEHIKYFTWQDTYKVHRSSFKFQEICDYMDTHNTSTQTNGQIIDWLKGNKCQTYQLPSAWGS